MFYLYLRYRCAHCMVLPLSLGGGAVLAALPLQTLIISLFDMHDPVKFKNLSATLRKISHLWLRLVNDDHDL